MLTPNQLTRQLSEIGEEYRVTLGDLREVDGNAVDAQLALKLAEARAYDASSGTVEERKHYVTRECHDERKTYEYAAMEHRAIVERIRYYRAQIDVLRTAAATSRTEWEHTQ
jgi:hypothetical protein